ncbi:MAG TPA: hypothetical protein VMH26_05975 [Burkholderiales bacterium]|nr:hypothetical protein [Burkholderiales bacterium]
MLIAALTAFLLIHFSAHSSAVSPQLDQTAQLIRKDVQDEARQKQALAIVDQMKGVTKSYAKQREGSMNALNALLGKRQTPASEIERAGQPLISADRVTAETLLDLRFQLKSVLTPSEWALVFPGPAADAAGKRKSA